MPTTMTVPPVYEYRYLGPTSNPNSFLPGEWLELKDPGQIATVLRIDPTGRVEIRVRPNPLCQE